MADKDLAQVWAEKIREADEFMRAWEKKFKVKDLEEYEEGFQLADNVDAYILNLFYATLEVKTPSLRFTKPIYHLKPSPKSVTELGEESYAIGQNIEDTINTYVLDERNNFHQEIISAISDSWSRFGIIESGYDATWINNPKIRAPKVSSDYIPGVDKRRQRVKRTEPELIPEQERIYVTNIPASRFRVSANDAAELWQCDWCGYYDYLRIEDILAIPGIKNKEELRQKASLETSMDETSREEKDRLDQASSLDLVKVWKIWDTRAQRKYCFSGEVLFYDKPYDIFPFEDLRFQRRKKDKGYYPLPVTFNWLSPQNEINEVRNAHRNHRRRFKRIYTANKMAFDDQTQEEIQNALLNGEDGTVLFASRDTPIQPVDNANLGSSANISMQVTLDDFNRITGTTSEMRGESDRTTATQAALTNERARVRESKEREQVADFIQRVGKKLITLHQSKLVNLLSVQSPSGEGELLDNFDPQPKVREIDPLIDLGDSRYDYSLLVQVSSISIIAADEEKNAMIEFLTLLNQFPQFGLSPTLIRELAYKTGYHNEKILQEFQQIAQLQMVGLMGQLQGSIAGPSGGPGSQQQLAQMTPPDQEQIRNQIQGQGVPING